MPAANNDHGVIVWSLSWEKRVGWANSFISSSEQLGFHAVSLSNGRTGNCSNGFEKSKRIGNGLKLFKMNSRDIRDQLYQQTLSFTSWFVSVSYTLLMTIPIELPVEREIPIKCPIPFEYIVLLLPIKIAFEKSSSSIPSPLSVPFACFPSRSLSSAQSPSKVPSPLIVTFACSSSRPLSSVRSPSLIHPLEMYRSLAPHQDRCRAFDPHR